MLRPVVRTPEGRKPSRKCRTELYEQVNILYDEIADIARRHADNTSTAPAVFITQLSKILDAYTTPF